MDNPYWTFPEFPVCDSFQIRYLCWRAVGENRETSTQMAEDGYMPASWSMLYRSEEERADDDY